MNLQQKSGRRRSGSRGRQVVVAWLVAATAVALVPSIGPAAAMGETFTVTRQGATSTYDAVSPTQSFTGDLKDVVEDAAAHLDANGGGTVHFVSGDFDLASDWFEIEELTDIVFEGEGIDVTFLRNNASASTDTEVFDFSNSDRITIRDLNVDAGGPARNTSDAIDFDGGDDSLIERVKVTNARGKGIIFDGKDSVATNGGTADGNIVRDCIVTGVPQDGIQFLASNDNLVENCQISDVGGHGISVNKSSSSADQPNKPSNDNQLIGNTLDQSGTHGIRINSSNRTLVSGNTITNSSDDASGRDGINIDSASGVACDDNIIEFNTATDNQTPKTQDYGLNIETSDCNRTVVRDNNFVGNLSGDINDDGTNTIYASNDTEPPTAPGNLTATSVQSSAVALSWTAATDNTGVVAYDVHRLDVGLVDSVPGATLTYTDTTVQGEMTYDYQVFARDGAGNVGPPSNTETVNTPPGPIVTTLDPTDDTTIRSSDPTDNYGGSSILELDLPARDIMLQFDLAGIDTAAVQQATLRLFNVNSSSAGGDFYETSTGWDEDVVTWNTAPGTIGGVIGSIGAVSPNNWYEVDVTSLVQGDADGIVALRTANHPTMNGADYASKENGNGNGPELVVELPNTPPVIDPGGSAVIEGSPQPNVVNVPLTLSAPSNDTVTVDWTTLDPVGVGIASSSAGDFVAASGVATFLPGETFTSVPVTVLDDADVEPEVLWGEWILVSFTNPVNATLDPTFFSLGIGVIIDDD